MKLSNSLKLLVLSSVVLFASNLLPASSNPTSSNISTVYAVDTCPQDNGWTKIDSGNLSTYPVSGATSYCFKAGPYLTYSYPSGGFGQNGACKENHIERCDLSHWSYFLPSGTPTPTPSDPGTPTPTRRCPCGSPTPTLTPTDVPQATPTHVPEATPTPTPGEGENPTPTPTNNPTPTPTNAPPIGGPGDGLSDGRSDGMSPQPAGIGGGDVLGASTMAATGTFATDVANSLMMFGSILTGISVAAYEKSKKARSGK